MIFTPLVTPLRAVERPAFWFAFQGVQILIRRDAAGASVPRLQHPSEIGLSPVREQYLGTLGGIDCFACEIDDGVTPPDGWNWSGLRGLFGLVDDAMFALAGRARLP